MSWLAKQIQAVLREKKDAATALKTMMEDVLVKYRNRHDDHQLRVHDKNGEGILYGKRKYVAVNAETKALELKCSRKKFNEKKEEAFSRGLFNQKRLAIGGHDALLISYEAPLLRKLSGQGGGVCKLDLVALEEAAIWAIEYKQTSDLATSARYGVLEALAYGFLLALHLRDSQEGVRLQVEECIVRRGPYPCPSVTLKSNTIKFAVAAPPAFYREDVCTNERLHLTETICKLACEYANDASNLLRIKLSFGGFIVVGDDNTRLRCEPASGESTEVTTRFVPPPKSLPVFDNISELRDSLEKIQR